MNYPSISIDTYDFVIIASLVGGFYTGVWWPTVLFLTWEFIKQWLEIDSVIKKS